MNYITNQGYVDLRKRCATVYNPFSILLLDQELNQDCRITGIWNKPKT